MATTRTGASYICVEGMYCDPSQGGCGVFEAGRLNHGQDDVQCDNCNHRPLSSVTVQTNDWIAS